jgi:tellurite resistance protein
MATKSDFTEDEWKALQKGVTGAGMLVSVSDRDFTDSFGEASALAKALAAQHAQGASDLVREIADIHGTGFGFTTSPQEVETETLAALGTATSALGSKAPEEAENYRQLVLAVADAVAEAKGGVSEAETAALGKVKSALGSTPPD